MKKIILPVALLALFTATTSWSYNLREDLGKRIRSCPNELAEVFTEAKGALNDLGFTQAVNFGCNNRDKSTTHAVCQKEALKGNLAAYLTRLFEPLIKLREQYEWDHDDTVEELALSENLTLEVVRAVKWQLENSLSLKTIVLYELSNRPVKVVRHWQDDSKKSASPELTLYLPVIDETFSDCDSAAFVEQAQAKDQGPNQRLLVELGREIKASDFVYASIPPIDRKQMPIGAKGGSRQFKR